MEKPNFRSSKMNFLTPAALSRLVKRKTPKTAKSSMIPREAGESGNIEASDSLSQVRRLTSPTHPTHPELFRKSEPARCPNTKAPAQWGGEAAPLIGPHPRPASQTHDKQRSKNLIPQASPQSIPPGRLRVRLTGWPAGGQQFGRAA
jgi:hypothetical protein